MPPPHLEIVSISTTAKPPFETRPYSVWHVTNPTPNLKRHIKMITMKKRLMVCGIVVLILSLGMIGEGGPELEQQQGRHGEVL
jgi:hypothetical protein